MFGSRAYGSSAYGAITQEKPVSLILPAAFSITASLKQPVIFTEEIATNLGITATLHQPTVTTINKSIVIKINTVDISNQVNYASLNVSNNLYSEPDIASFEIIKSTSKSYSPAAGDEVEIIDTGVTIFKGLLVKISKELQGFSELYSLEFRDWTEELANIIVAENYVNMTVNAIIADINTNYLTGYDITNVADTTVVAGITFDNISVVQALDQLAELSGKNWYVSPEKEIYFFANSTIQSPFDLTDTNGKYDYSSLRIDEDLTQIRNKVTIKGNGIAAVTVEDLTSQGLYGVREYFERDNDIDATNEATQKANAILAAYKDSIKVVSFQTKSAGLFAGQQIDIDSTIRGINETLNIERIDFQAETAMRFVYRVNATSQRLGRIEDLFKQASESTNITPAVGDQNNLNDVEFSAIDDETISWTAGTVRTSSGVNYSISAKASQVLTADHVIYLDPSVSVTDLQISTNFADGIGQGKIPMAYATKSAVATKGADIFPIGFGGKMQLDGSVHITDRSIIADNIAANAITANEIAASTITATQIAASTITADRMNVTQLSAITATMGTLNVSSATTGANVRIDSTNRRIAWLYDNVEKAYAYADSGGNFILDADNLLYLRADGAGDDIYLQAGDQILITGNDLIPTLSGNWQINEADEHFLNFNSDNTNASCQWQDHATSDVLMRLQSTDESLYIDGTFIDTGADFAEFFEATPEYSQAKIPNGTSVVLVGDKIRPAIHGETPFGVISAKPTIIGNGGGNGCNNEYGGKYLVDDFGNAIIEEKEWWSIRKIEKKTRDKKGKKEEYDVEKRYNGWSDKKEPMEGSERRMKKRKVLNPNWNPDEVYIPRSERPEWNVVGLVGRIRMLKGQPTASNWVKLRDISDMVEEWLVR